MSDMRDVGALVWAGKMYGGSATLFKYLAIGDKFHFPHAPEKVMTKVSKNGWYSQPWNGIPGGKRFRTGTLTAVIPVAESRQNPAGKPRRSTSLAGLEPSKKWRRKCPFCSAKTNIDRLGSSSRTWQQWQCPECGKWVDRHSGGPRRNPGLGMPGMPHTWVTRSGEHVSAGDQVEYWSSEGGYHDRKKVRRKGTVMRYLVFNDHVQVKKGPFGATVDDSNFIRVTRRGR